MFDRWLEFWGYETRREFDETVRRHAAVALRLYLLALGAFAVFAVIGDKLKCL
jgi:hypothetical protein